MQLETTPRLKTIFALFLLGSLTVFLLNRPGGPLRMGTQSAPPGVQVILNALNGQKVEVKEGFRAFQAPSKPKGQDGILEFRVKHKSLKHAEIIQVSENTGHPSYEAMRQVCGRVGVRQIEEVFLYAMSQPKGDPYQPGSWFRVEPIYPPENPQAVVQEAQEYLRKYRGERLTLDGYEYTGPWTGEWILPRNTDPTAKRSSVMMFYTIGSDD